MDTSTPAATPPPPKATSLGPKDHDEAIAIFFSEIVGALTRKELDHGELRAALRALPTERFRPPGSETTKHFSLPMPFAWGAGAYRIQYTCAADTSLVAELALAFQGEPQRQPASAPAEARAPSRTQ